MLNIQLSLSWDWDILDYPPPVYWPLRVSTVCGCDVNPAVVNTINAGNIHIVEPELNILVRSAVNSGQLTASLTPQPADIFIIAVPTPVREDHTPDLSYVKAAAQEIAPCIQPG